MFHLMMLLLGLSMLTSRTGSQNSSLQIVFPEKIQANISDNSEVEYKQISYIIPIDEKPYTVHLKQRFFLADNFMVYVYNKGSLNSHSSNIQTQCYYQGYVEGYLNSIVILNTCSGLRGILQFENVSYGIEPLEAEVEFQHILYKLRNENNEFVVSTEDNNGIGPRSMDSSIFISEKSESTVPDLTPLYLEMHIVVDKILYGYLGSDSTVVTNKVIEIIGLVNSVLSQLKVTVVLSSLELWSDKNKISTDGEAEELLRRFLEWKNSYLTLRPHDIAYLFIYRDYPDYVGATFPGKMCVTQYSAGIALYPKEISLEAFSVIVTQMLGLSLGISYDDSKKCQCSGMNCVMNPEAMQSSGAKTFSNCSLDDFKNFISNPGARCLQNKPQMQRASASVCGNGRVESPETCDCGTQEQCGTSSCCDPQRCVLKPGSQCDKDLCCNNCKFRSAGSSCRPAVHPECDLPEVCNGSSGACDPDVTILNGRVCKGRYMCYNGDCQDLNVRCEKLFGKGSENAPFACYEEIQSQLDRFGNCGVANRKYKICLWRNLICGRLICTYPSRSPHNEKNVAVLYAFVQKVVCITVDYRVRASPTDKFVDPMMVSDGSECDTERVCTSKLECHCDKGWSNPNCSQNFRDASGESPGLITERAFWKSRRNQWLLGSCIVSSVLIVATMIAISRNRLKKWFTKEEESQSSESRSESSNQTDIVRSTSERSAQTYTSRSKSQETTKT